MRKSTPSSEVFRMESEPPPPPITDKSTPEEVGAWLQYFANQNALCEKKREKLNPLKLAGRLFNLMFVFLLINFILLIKAEVYYPSQKLNYVNRSAT